MHTFVFPIWLRQKRASKGTFIGPLAVNSPGEETASTAGIKCCGKKVRNYLS